MFGRAAAGGVLVADSSARTGCDEHVRINEQRVKANFWGMVSDACIERNRKLLRSLLLVRSLWNPSFGCGLKVIVDVYMMGQREFQTFRGGPSDSSLADVTSAVLEDGQGWRCVTPFATVCYSMFPPEQGAIKEYDRSTRQTRTANSVYQSRRPNSWIFRCSATSCHARTASASRQ